MNGRRLTIGASGLLTRVCACVCLWFAFDGHWRHQDPKMGDWLWEIRERRRQRERSSNYRQLARLTSAERNPANPQEDGSPVNGSSGINNTSNDSQVIERFLNEGKWLVSDRQIADHKMVKDRHREKPVSNAKIHSKVKSTAPFALSQFE